jgi:hypothetical protein
MRRLRFVLGIVSLALGLGTALSAPPSAEEIYKAYAKHPEKGITKQEFEQYLKDSTLSPGLKRLYDGGNAAVVAAVDADTSAETDTAFIRQSVAPGEPMSPASFKDYLAAFPPRKTILPQTPPQTSKPTTPAAKPAPKGILDGLTNSKLHDDALHVTRSAPGPGVFGSIDPGPAQLNWTHAAGSADVFTIDAAVSYIYEVESLKKSKFFGYYPSLSIVPSFEAHTSTSATATQDSLKGKLDFQFALNPDYASADAPPLQALSIAPAYEGDRVKKTETYGGDIFYTPFIKGIGMGTLMPLSFGPPPTSPVATPEEALRRAYPAFIWSPSIGFEIGHATMDDTAVYGNDPDYVRFVAKVKLDVFLFPQFDLGLAYAGRVFLTGDDRAFSFFNVTPTWYLGSAADVQDKKKIHFAVGLDFKDGETTPNFKHVDSLSAFIGVKF